MTGYPTNKQQLNAALRNHLQYVSETETETETLGEVSDRNWRSVFSCRAPRRPRSQPPPLSSAMTRWTGHWCPQLRYATTR
jgi:hypothetical protein